MSYQKRTIEVFGQTLEVIMSSTGGQIPRDPENTDYQAFLEWEAAGNVAPEWTPEP